MITVLGIPYRDVRDQPELLAEYAEECSIAAIGTPDPQWETYAAMESGGWMQVFAVYVDGRMVGFASVLAAVLPHYGVKVATVESLFVSKAWRGLASVRLMESVNQHAAYMGCKAILYSAPAGGKLEALLDGRYARTNSVFCLSLGGPA